MSDNKEIYHHAEHQLKDQYGYGGAFPFNNSGTPLLISDYLQDTMDYGVLARAFDMSYSPSSNKEVNQIMTQVDPTSAPASGTGGGSGSGTPMTPNSSISSASTEAAGEDQDSGGSKKEQQQQQAQAVGGDGCTDKSKKVMKPRKKGEKRERQPRFAFMTKSDVDHLEDGYRWRKYGQKAVKNSPFPRSYYRCTAPKCSVKKRVERSYQDPTVVVTTYEGQHTHQSPANLRGNSLILAANPAIAPVTGVRRELLMHQHQHQPMHPTLDGQGGTNPFSFLQNMSPASSQQFRLQADHGLLEDIVPPFFQNKQ